MSSQTVEHLRNEHKKIETVLAAFEHYLNTAIQNETVDHHEMGELVNYLTESLFLLHEEKEETVLLPELARHGLSWSDGTLSHVRQDHRHGRYLLRSLRQAASERRAWTEEKRRQVASVGKEWIEFNRRHMAHEESQLFPFLDSSLDAEEDSAVVAQFQRIDAEFEEMEDAQEMRQSREQFVTKYSPASD